MQQQLFACLALVLAALVCGTLSESSSIRSATVITNLPWYMKFSFEQQLLHFQPLILRAKQFRALQHQHLHRSSSKPKAMPMTLVSNIEFFAFDERDNRRSFLNRDPQSFRPDDVLSLELIYAAASSTRRRILFDYTISSQVGDNVVFDLSLSESHTNEAKASAAGGGGGHGDGGAPLSPNAECNETCSQLQYAHDYQQELLSTALSHGKFGTRLLLTGVHEQQQQEANAADAMRKFLIERLEVPHLIHSILQAKFIDEGLLFELRSPNDVIEVLTQARLLLDPTTFAIKRTDRDFVENVIMPRMPK